MIDSVLVACVERGMKAIALNHARKKMEDYGIPDMEARLAEYEKLDSRTLWQVVTILWGEPKVPENDA